MMKKDKKVRIALSSVLLLAVVAAGVTMYRSESNLKRMEEEQAEEQQMAENKPLPGLSEGQEEAMEGGNEEPEIADVTTNEAQAENTQELNGGETSDSETPEASETKAEEEKQDETPAEETADTAAPVQPELNFSEDSTMVWPVSGEVLIDYSMDATTYFPTLDLYKYNEAVVLRSAAGDPVQAAANGQVVSIVENEETGTTLTMDLGNGYQAVYGQLKDLAVAEGQIVESGTILGYVQEPTKYYVTEGENLYFAMTKDGKAVDPMIYLETVTE